MKPAKDICSTRVLDSFTRSKAIFCLGKCAFIILVWLRVSETFGRILVTLAFDTPVLFCENTATTLRL